jgi:hypothetical protein
VCDFNLNVERISGRENAFRQTRQWHSRVAELGELVPAGVTLWLPECVEQSNQGSPLAQIIMQIQQLKSTQARRSQIGLDLFLVAGKLKPT